MLTTNDPPILAATLPQQSNYVGEGVSSAQKPACAPLAIESILEHIVATYGHDKLPQLLAVLGEQSSPDSFISMLFGVSRTDFEASWQVYLAQHY